MLVFLHGVPETAALWNELRAALDHESTALSLPGFGTERPEGFSATKEAYLDWLVGEIRAMGAPVDLIGHDWGAPLCFHLTVQHPELVRSLTIDMASGLHPAYQWHAFAQIWQTPGEGEAFFEGQLATPVHERAEVYGAAFGLDVSAATALVEMLDPTMASCIVDLYRSALPNIAASWPLPTAPLGVPVLFLDATEDPFADATLKEQVLGQLGFEVARLEGCSHFWALQDPVHAAQVIDGFVGSVGER